MAERIPKLIPGRAPTLLNARLANHLIGLYNSLTNCQGLIITDENSRIDLEYLQAQIRAVLDKLNVGSGSVEGFDEETITICDSGTPTDRIFLTKDPP